MPKGSGLLSLAPALRDVQVLDANASQACIRGLLHLNLLAVDLLQGFRSNAL